jgi:sulfide dehydrogenase cytochrome subunit
MNRCSLIAPSAVLVAAALGAGAQQPAPVAPPAPPAFAPSNLTESGVRAMAANCAACHGTQGRPLPGSPVAGLAGRSAAEIADIMAQFKEGKRNPTVMHQIAKGYSEPEVHAIANYFSRLER